MEVINELNTKDINTALLKVKRDLIATQGNINKVIDDTEIDIDEKSKLISEFRDKIILYNKVLEAVINTLIEYFNKNYVTIYNLSLSQWVSQYKTNFSCVYQNSINENFYLDDDLELNCTSCNSSCNSSYVTPTCSTCNSSCNACNSAQSSCTASYNQARSFSELGTVCNSGYSVSGCNSLFTVPELNI